MKLSDQLEEAMKGAIDSDGFMPIRYAVGENVYLMQAESQITMTRADAVRLAQVLLLLATEKEADRG